MVFDEHAFPYRATQATLVAHSLPTTGPVQTTGNSSSSFSTSTSPSHILAPPTLSTLVTTSDLPTTSTDIPPPETIAQVPGSSSPTGEVTTPQRTHSMVTRSHDGSLLPRRFNISRHHIAFHISVDFQEPTSFSKARKIPQWRAAMHEEFQALLHHNHTWDLVPPEPSQNVIGCKWVYRVKQKADGTLDRYKARLVVKGFNQRQGIDYDETFSLVIKPVTIRTILSIDSRKSVLNVLK